MTRLWRFVAVCGEMGQIGGTTGSGRRNRKRDRTRAEILAAAATLAEHTSFERASVAAICEAADVARATFFLHFANKQALLDALEAALESELERAVRDVRPRAAALLRALSRSQLP